MNLEQFKKNGKYLMLALDHRGSFKKLINSQNPKSVSDQEAIDLKAEIIKSLEDQFSGLLIDIDYGLPAYEANKKPYLLPLEKSGYLSHGGERITELERSVSELRDLGASGAKLLLYFNPFLKTAIKQLQTAKKALDQCELNSFPLFLELVTYEKEGKSEDEQSSSSNRERLVLGSINMFLEAKIKSDVFKLEYPGSLDACNRITQALSGLPWILLTRGVTFDEFVPQLKDAISAGAQGFLAGRALWQEVCKLEGEDPSTGSTGSPQAGSGQGKKKFLTATLPERFKIISKIASA